MITVVNRKFTSKFLKFLKIASFWLEPTTSNIKLTMTSHSYKEFIKSLILLQNPCFEASRGWVRQFKERHNIAQRKKTLCQKLPSQLGSKISSFYSECIRFLKIGKYPLPLIGHIDETPVFFDMVPEKSLVQKG